MAYTRGQLRDLCRRRLGDLAVPYKWSDLQVNQWINDAIADYSIHFPRRVALKIDCATGMHTYDLPADCHAVLRVEYPHGEYPPKYLQLSDSASPFFYDSGYLYDFAPAMDADTPGQIIISASPLSIEDIEIIYQGDHTYLDDDAGEVTVLDRHLELVMLYVRWAAYQELATTESSDPDPTSLALSTLELNAYRAQRLYLQALDKTQQAESISATVHWVMNGWD